MHIVSFDPFQTLGMPNTRNLSSHNFFKDISLLMQADWILYPEYWQVNTIHYVLNKRIFPSIATYHLGHNKLEMTRALLAMVPHFVPETYILPNTVENRERFTREVFSFPFVAKDFKNSQGKGVYLIENREQWSTYCENSEVLYAQELLPIDRDMRLVVIGKKVIAGYWRLQEQGLFHTNVSRGGIVSHEEIPSQAVSLVEWVAQKMDINHAGFDVAQVNGHYYIFEFNRLFGNQGLREKGINLTEIVYDYLLEETHYIRDPHLPQNITNKRAA